MDVKMFVDIAVVANAMEDVTLAVPVVVKLPALAVALKLVLDL